MKLQHLIQQIYYEPSLITADAHASIRQLIESRLGVLADGQPTIFQARKPGEGICGEKVEVEQMEIIDGIAHIPIGGAIGQKLSPFERGDGAVDVLDVIDELDQAEDDESVQAVLLDIDSPGGMFVGTPELAARIESFDKPIFCFSNGLIASAAYWIASATDGIFTTRSASIGSIGVYLLVPDYTGWFAQKGIKIDVLKAGKLKGIGIPGTSLSDTSRDHLQARVNEIYKMFTAHVRLHRGDISDGTMQGQVFLADEALRRDLIDAIVRDKAEAIDIVRGFLAD